MIASILLAVSLCALPAHCTWRTGELVYNGGAESGATSGWTHHSGATMGRFSTGVSGKVGSWFFYGGSNDGQYYQWINVWSHADEINNGNAYAEFSARIGGYNNDGDRARVHFDLCPSTSSCPQRRTLNWVSNGDRGGSSKMLYRSSTYCRVPSNTRYIRVWLEFDKIGWFFNFDNDGYLDAISAKLILSQRAGINKNLVMGPGAEWGQSLCFWNNENNYLARRTDWISGRAGSWYYYGGTTSYSRASQWISVNRDWSGINSNQRSLTASALLGGYGNIDDYVTLRVEQWNSARNHHYRSYTLDLIKAAQRAWSSKFIYVEGGDCIVHSGTRYLKLVLEFRRYAYTVNDGFVDNIDVRLVPRIAAKPSFALNSNLVWMGGGEYASWSCIWQREAGAPKSRSSPNYVNRRGSQVISGLEGHAAARAYQWIDVSADSSQIAAGNRAVKLSAWAGGVGGDTDEAKAWVEAWSSGKSTKLQTVALPPISPAARASVTALLYNQDGLCVLPTGTRWLKVYFEAKRNSGTPNDAAIDDITVAVVPARKAPAAYPGVGANLAWAAGFEGAEGHPWSCQWARERSFPRLSSNAVAGKQGSTFISGETPSDMLLFQWVDVSGDATWIDRGKRQLKTSAWLGGSGGHHDHAVVMALAYDASKATVLQTSGDLSVTVSDRGSATKLLHREDTMPCAVPPGTRWLKLYMKVYYSGSGWNDAYVDDVRMMLVAAPTALDTNLVLAHGAEHALWRCAWAMESNTMERRDTAVAAPEGQYYYYGGSTAAARAAQWVDLTHDATAINNNQRSLTVSAFLGGYGNIDDFVTVRVEQWDAARTTRLRQVELDVVKAAQRGSLTKFMHVEGGDCVVHPSTRHLKLVLAFQRLTPTISDGYVDRLDLRLVPRIAAKPTFALNSNLVWMGGGEYASWACVWEREAGAPMSRGSPAYSGRVGTQVISGLDGHAAARAYQWIDVSSDSTAISAGNRGVKLWAKLGGSAADPDAGKAWVEAWSSGKTTKLQTVTLPFVDPAARDSATIVLHNEDGLCILPTGTRWLKVYFEAKRNSGTPNDAAIDDITVAVVPARKAPATYPGVGANLAWAAGFEGAEGHPWSCQWAREEGFPRRVTTAVSGKQGSTFLAGATSSNVMLYQWVDVSGDATWIDRGKRQLKTSAWLGGSGALHDNTVVKAYAFNAGRTTALQDGTDLLVLRDDRGSATKLLHREDTMPCAVPVGTRWLKLCVRAYHAGGWNDAYVDDVRMMLVAAPTALDTNLVLAHGAEHALWRCAWAMESNTMERRDTAVAAPEGQYYYYGGSTAAARAAQWVDLTHDATAINNNQRSLTVSAFLGGYGNIDDFVTVRVEQWDAARTTRLRQVELDVVKAAQRGSLTKFMHVEGGDCVVHPSTRHLKLVLAFQRLTPTISDGYVDRLDLRLVPRIAAKPTFALNSNLVWMGGGEYASWACVWERDVGAPATVTRAFIDRDGTATIGALPGHALVRTYQWLDLSADAAAIAAGTRALRVAARAGGIGAEADTAVVAVEAWDAGKTVRLAAASVAAVSPAERNSEDRLMPEEDGLCALPAGTRWAKVVLESRRAVGVAADGALDVVDVRVVAARPTAPPLPLQLETNLLRNGGGETALWSCEWAAAAPGPRLERMAAAAAGREGGGMLAAFSRFSSGTAEVAQWVDVSSVAALIDANARTLTVGGLLGGSGATATPAVVEVTAFDAAKTAVLGGHATIGPVGVADRGAAAAVVPRWNSSKIPPGTRHLRVRVLIGSGPFGSTFVDGLSLVLNHSAPSVTATGSATPAVSVSASVLSTATASFTPSPDASKTETAVATATSTAHATQSATPIGTVSQSGSSTHTRSVLGSATASVPATSTGSPTATHLVTATASYSNTAKRSATATMASTPTTTVASTGTVSALATQTTSRSVSTTVAASPTLTPHGTLTLSAAWTATTTHVATATASLGRTVTGTLSVTASGTVPPTTTPSATGTLTLETSPTPTALLTATASRPATPSSSTTGTLTLALSATNTILPTATVSTARSGTFTRSSTLLPSATASVTRSATATVAVSRTESSVASPTLTAAMTTTRTATGTLTMPASLTATAAVTPTASGAATSTHTTALSTTGTGARTATTTAALTPSPERTTTVSVSSSATASMAATATDPPPPTPSATASTTVSATASVSSAVSGTLSVHGTVTPSATPTSQLSVSSTGSHHRTATGTLALSMTVTVTAGTKTRHATASVTAAATLTTTRLRTESATTSATRTFTAPQSTSQSTALSASVTHTATAGPLATMSVSSTGSHTSVPTGTTTRVQTTSPTHTASLTVASSATANASSTLSGVLSSTASSPATPSLTRPLTVSRTVTSTADHTASVTVPGLPTPSRTWTSTRSSSMSAVVSATATALRTITQSSKPTSTLSLPQSATSTLTPSLSPPRTGTESAPVTATASKTATAGRTASSTAARTATANATATHAELSTTASLPATASWTLHPTVSLSSTASHEPSATQHRGIPTATASATTTPSAGRPATATKSSDTTATAPLSVTSGPTATTAVTATAHPTPTLPKNATATPSASIKATPVVRSPSSVTPSLSGSVPLLAAGPSTNTTTHTRSVDHDPTTTATSVSRTMTATVRVPVPGPPLGTDAPAPDDGAAAVHPFVAVFGLTGACSGRLNFLPLLMLAFGAVVVARVAYTAAVRRYRDDSPDCHETVHVPRWRSLVRQHAWVGLVWPCHHYCGPDHAAIAVVKLLALICASAAFTNQFAALLGADPAGSTTVVGALAAVVAVALQPPLTALFAWYTLLDRRQELHVAAGPSHRYVPSDLQQFGVKRPLSVGLSDTTIAAFELLQVRRGRRQSTSASTASTAPKPGALLVDADDGAREAKLRCVIGAPERNSFFAPADGDASDDDVLPGDLPEFDPCDSDVSCSGHAPSPGASDAGTADGSDGEEGVEGRRRKAQRLESLALVVNVEDYVADLHEDDLAIEEAVMNADAYVNSKLDLGDLGGSSDDDVVPLRHHRRPPRGAPRPPRRPNPKGAPQPAPRRLSRAGSSAALADVASPTRWHRSGSVASGAAVDPNDGAALRSSFRSAGTATLSSLGDGSFGRPSLGDSIPSDPEGRAPSMPSADPAPPSGGDAAALDEDLSELSELLDASPSAPAAAATSTTAGKPSSCHSSDWPSDEDDGAACAARTTSPGTPPTEERPRARPSPGTTAVSFVGAEAEGLEPVRLPGAEEGKEDSTSPRDDTTTPPMFEGFDTVVAGSFFDVGPGHARPPPRLPSGVKRRDPRTCVVVQRRVYHVAAWATALAMAAVLVGLIYAAGAFHWCAGMRRQLFWRVVAVACAVDVAVLQPLYIGAVALYRWVTADTADGAGTGDAARAPQHELHPIHGQWRHVGLLTHAHQDEHSAAAGPALMKHRSFAATTDAGLRSFTALAAGPSSRSFAYAPRDAAATAGRVERLRSGAAFRNFSFSQMDGSLAAAHGGGGI